MEGLGGGAAFSYERGTPATTFNRAPVLCPDDATAHASTLCVWKVHLHCFQTTLDSVMRHLDGRCMRSVDPHTFSSSLFLSSLEFSDTQVYAP